MADKVCEALTRRGTPCKSPPLAGRTVCYFHATDAETVAARFAARAKGGKSTRRSLPPGAVPGELKDAGDTLPLLQKVILGVCDGSVNAQVGNTVAALTRVFIAASETAQLERRVAKLEQERSGV